MHKKKCQRKPIIPIIGNRANVAMINFNAEIPMAAAAGYFINIPPDRRELILDSADATHYYPGSSPGEPVPVFQHSRDLPLIVFASFADSYITHLADGRKGVSAGTGLVRLNFDNLEELQRAIPFEALIDAVPRRFKAHVRAAIVGGGLVPPKTFLAVVDAVSQINDQASRRLSRFSRRRAAAVARLTTNERANLALQKETLTAALEIAGISRNEILNWAPTENPPRSFLEGLPQVRVREDVMLIADYANLPGFRPISESSHFAARTFQSAHSEIPGEPAPRLTVLMANRTALEQQTGADLIYYNESFGAFVFVQYKAMETDDNGYSFRWRRNDQFMDEIDRMNEVMAELARVQPDSDPESFRFSADSFFLKFCPRVTFNPDDKGLFPGIYLPLNLWKRLNQSRRFAGPRSGYVLTYNNVGRRLSNTDFVTLLRNAWVGTTVSQSAALENAIRAALETGKTVTFAAKRKAAAGSVGFRRPKLRFFFGGRH